MNSGKITSVFDIPELEEEETDYRKLYEKEKRMRVFFQQKTHQLQKKMTVQFKDHQFTTSNHKAQHAQEMMEGIKSFKSILPFSVKIIPNGDSNQSIDNGVAPPLITQWAIYGLKEQQIGSQVDASKQQPSILACSSQPSQILEHTARLVFPSGIGTHPLEGKNAQESGLDIINLSKQKLKTFILAYEPTSVQDRSQSLSQAQETTLQIINQLNPERRIYAICLQLNDFTVTQQDNTMIQLKTTRKTNKSVKSVKFQSLVSNRQNNQLVSVVSKRVYTIFSYYPFFAFFQEMLKSIIFAVKVQRYIKFKEGGQNLKVVDSRLHCNLIKKAMKDLKEESAGKAIVADKLLDFAVCGNNKSYLQLSKEALTYSMAQEWAYYVFSLFTLDVFLDVLTLMALQQKMVFVCTNATILTHAIYLFTKVLIKPFEYPYPVVNLIPDQEEYLNAPFPVVYGYLKSKEDIIDAKLHKKYKNVYVFFEPEGVSIVCQEDKKKMLNKKSPRLRDRLISKFKTMRRNYPSTIFDFIKKKTREFEFPVNIELSREIISQICNYMEKDIYNLLPDQPTVDAIKKELLSTKEIEEQDVNRETYLRIKEEYGPKSKDPFFAAFLETQLLNVFIFKY